jgi:hypothetical protein
MTHSTVHQHAGGACKCGCGKCCMISSRGHTCAAVPSGCSYCTKAKKKARMQAARQATVGEKVLQSMTTAYFGVGRCKAGRVGSWKHKPCTADEQHCTTAVGRLHSSRAGQTMGAAGAVQSTYFHQILRLIVLCSSKDAFHVNTCSSSWSKDLCCSHACYHMGVTGKQILTPVCHSIPSTYL